MQNGKLKSIILRHHLSQSVIEKQRLCTLNLTRVPVINTLVYVNSTPFFSKDHLQ